MLAFVSSLIDRPRKLAGVSKSKVVPISHLVQMLGGSEMHTGAALDGVPQDMSEPEVCSVPDASSCVVLPWKQDTAWFASDLSVSGPGGIGADELQPFEPCSRRILGRVLTKARNMGFVADFGTEAEFFVLKDCEVRPVRSLLAAQGHSHVCLGMTGAGRERWFRATEF